jgi:UDP-N-acetylmuramate dehydrogenase
MSVSPALPGHLAVREREPLARHSTFGVGGPADLWVEVHAVDDLVAVLDAAEATGTPRTVVGHGTNLLVADAGIAGLVVSNNCVGLMFDAAAGLARVESGHTMARLARQAAAGGHAGLGFAIGVPGTVGGAVFGNAGAWGSDIAAVLASAEVWYPDGVRRLGPDDLAFGYRHSALQDDRQTPVVLSASLGIQPGDPEALQVQLETFARRRLDTQPRGQNAGSFFKNPSGDYAGRLIESAGLKGCARGG